MTVELFFRVIEASGRPRKERRTENESSWTADDDDDDDDNDNDNDSSSGYSFSPTPAKRNGDSKPCAKALYDFEPGIRDQRTYQTIIQIIQTIYKL